MLVGENAGVLPPFRWDVRREIDQAKREALAVDEGWVDRAINNGELTR